jgi:hypothetical protein
MFTSHRNNENILQQNNLLGKINKPKAALSSTAGSTNSLHDAKKSNLSIKASQLMRAPLTSIQNRLHEREASLQQQTLLKAANNVAHSSPVMKQERTTPNGKSSIYAPKRRDLKMDSPGIDLLDRHDPQMVGEFAKDIFQHAKTNELKYLPEPNYIEKYQPKLTSAMRAIVLDWVTNVHRKFHLLPETLFLTINIFDRFLSVKQVDKTRLQLVVMASLLIASKYEEVYYPDISLYEKVAHNSFTRNELLQMERIILAALDFNITVVTPFPFITRYTKCGKIGPEGQLLALYFTELAVQDYRFLKFAPSVIACTALYLSNKFMKRADPWCLHLQYYSGYNTDDLSECSNMLLGIIKEQRNSDLKHCASRNKYLREDHMFVAHIVLGTAQGIEL